MEILKTEKLKKYYNQTSVVVKAIDGVDISVSRGEFVAVVGTSGSGKSTLLHMVGGLDRPTEGKVYIDGKDIFSLKDEELTVFRRRKIGFVFQAYNLVPVLNVYENIVLPIQLDGNEVEEDYVNEIIDILGLTEKKNSMPNQLSGGQQQRVLLARALCAAGRMLFLDEPVAGLDPDAAQNMYETISDINKSGIAVMMISHDLGATKTYADRVIRIEKEVRYSAS